MFVQAEQLIKIKKKTEKEMKNERFPSKDLLKWWGHLLI